MVADPGEEEALVVEAAADGVNARKDPNNNVNIKGVFENHFEKPSDKFQVLYCVTLTPSEALISLTATYLPFLF